MQNADMPPPSLRAMPSASTCSSSGGYTGLSAARETAQAGRSTLVSTPAKSAPGVRAATEARSPTASSPHSILEGEVRRGVGLSASAARGIDAVPYLRSLAKQQVDCDWREDGCFFGAHTARHYVQMARDAENQPRGLEQRISVVPKRNNTARSPAISITEVACTMTMASVDPPVCCSAVSAGALDGRGMGRGSLPGRRHHPIRDGFEAPGHRAESFIARQVLLATNGLLGSAIPCSAASHRHRRYQLRPSP